MTATVATQNRRILVNDDTTSVLEDFRKILAPSLGSDALSEARATPFGEAPSLPVREPITTLTGTATLLQDDPLNPAQRNLVVTIQQRAQDIMTLLTRMQEFMAGDRSSLVQPFDRTAADR